MKYVLFYSGGSRERAMEHFAAHKAHGDAFHGRGLLLAYGPFIDPAEGAMAVFATREAAEEFVAGDPFVVNGVVGTWRIAEWKEAFLPEVTASGAPRSS